MAKEIERKFLVITDSYRQIAVSARNIIQGYISRRKEGTVRVRIVDDRAFLTVKGINIGAVRSEWEYEIPMDDARQMLEECCVGGVIAKTRYIVPIGDLTWEVDCFEGVLAPLTVAEVELADADAPVEIPDFIGAEVTGDPAYYNSELSAKAEAATQKSTKNVKGL